MNLLHDKREEEQSLPKPDFHEVTPPPKIEEQPQLDFTQTNSPYPEESENKKQTSLKAFLLTLILLIIVSAAAYFVFFKDALNLFNKTPQQQTIVHETRGGFVDPNETVINEQVPAQTDAGQEQASEITDDSSVTPAPVTQEPVATNGTGNPLSTIALTVSNFSQILGGTAKINTLFFDENTFWAEIQCSDAASARTVYSTIQTNLSNVLSLSSPQPDNAKFLVSGNMNIESALTGISVSKSEIETNLTALSSQAGVVLASSQVTAHTNAQQSVFTKVSGSLEQCANYIDGLGRLGWNVKISKIIFTPKSASQMSLTLRFLVR